eukprot:TRINITY_DN16451_c0_g1_i1.p1 TRINITY_DN16451_c0_g1~~TRINITY_DN16451_c0_g1_i1.p1  ORF type:complete len:171 (-),score=51.21 TRINITY_DN16451_c0_g1_i1:42-554(-)
MGMLVGIPPFTGETPEEIFENILNNRRDTELEVGNEEEQVSPEAADLIEKLLSKDPEKRLGMKGAEEVKAHPFFNGISWAALRENEPPFIPEVADPADASYFPKMKFKVTDSSPKDESAVQKQLGFNFDTTNVETLAQKNKDALKNDCDSEILKQVYTFLALDYEPEELC